MRANPLLLVDHPEPEARELPIEIAEHVAQRRPGRLDLLRAGGISAQLRRDYYRTLTELYELNFVAVFQRWAAGHGVPFRIQGYGSPPAGV